jgi:hypothetical protein
MSDVKIIFSAETQAALAKVQNFFAGVQRDINSLGNALQLGLGIDVGRRLLDGFLQIPGAIRGAVQSGIEFNRTLEDARLGIAAVLKQFNPQQFATMQQALKASESALDALKKKALESPATLSQLVQTFQAVAAAASSAGIPLEKQVDLVVLMSQTLAGIGIRSEQLIQESRALLTGNITEDAAAARMLEITRAQIEAAKEQGRLYEFLTEKFSAFAEAAQLGTKNLTTAQSNLTDTLQQTFGALTETLFGRLKTSILEVTQEVAKPDFKQGLSEMAGIINGLVQATIGLGMFAVRNVSTLASVFTTLTASVVAATAAMIAFKVASAVGATQFLGLLGAITSFADLRAMIALTATQTVSATASMGVAIGGLVAIIYTGVEAWRAFKAGQEKALALSNLEGSNDRFAEALRKDIAERVDQGAITEEQAAEFRRRIAEAMARREKLVESIGAMHGASTRTREVRNPSREHDELRAVWTELAGIRTTAQVEAAEKEKQISKATADAHRQVMLASIEFESAAWEAQYAQRVITLEEFHERQRALLEDAFALELEIGNKTDAEKEALGFKHEQRLLDLDERVRKERAAAAEREETEQRQRDESSARSVEAIHQQWEESHLERAQLLEAQHARELAQLTDEVASYEDFLRAKELLDQTYASRRLQLQREMEQRVLSVRLSENDLAVARVRGDGDLSEETRLQSLKILLGERNQLLDDAIAKERERLSLTVAGSEEEAALKERIIQLLGQQLYIQQEIADREREINRQRLQGTRDMFQNMATAAKAFGKEGFAAYKAFAIAAATIDTAQAAIAAYKAVVGIPYVGPVLAPIAAAAAVAAGAAQIGAISAQGYEHGGLVRGGEQIVRINERGEEFVVNAKATARNRALLEQINAGIAPRVRPVTASASTLQAQAPGLVVDGSGAAAPNVNVAAPEVHVIVVKSEEEVFQALESARGGRAVVRHVRDNKTDAGMES